MTATYVSPIYKISFQIASDEDPSCLLDAAQAAAEEMAAEVECTLTEDERSASACAAPRRSDKHRQRLHQALRIAAAVAGDLPHPSPLHYRQIQALQTVIAEARRGLA